jgi:hypothetical protein
MMNDSKLFFDFFFLTKIKMPEKIESLSKSPKKAVAEKKGKSWINLLVWFLVASILAYVILYSWNPSQLQKNDLLGKPTGVSDPTKTILASVGAGLIVLLIVWFFQRK